VKRRKKEKAGEGTGNHRILLCDDLLISASFGNQEQGKSTIRGRGRKEGRHRARPESPAFLHHAHARRRVRGKKLEGKEKKPCAFLPIGYTYIGALRWRTWGKFWGEREEPPIANLAQPLLLACGPDARGQESTKEGERRKRRRPLRTSQPCRTRRNSSCSTSHLTGREPCVQWGGEGGGGKRLRKKKKEEEEKNELA